MEWMDWVVILNMGLIWLGAPACVGPEFWRTARRALPWWGRLWGGWCLLPLALVALNLARRRD